MSGSDPALPDEVLAEAAEWFATLGDEPVSEAERQRWRAWLAASESHRRAWRRLADLDRRLGTLPAAPARRALSAAGRSRRRFLKGGAGLAVLAASGGLAWSRAPLWRADLRTTVGEIREQPLPDGGRLWLNTDTAVDLDYSADHRRLRLLAGEVLIETAADPRPFTVLTAAGAARPLGTRFGVRLTDTGTRVAVWSGRVALAPADAPGRGAVVAAGQQRHFDARHCAAATPLAGHGGAGWERGMLVADDRPLGEFLEELSRYRRGVIHCDPDAAGLRLVGSFPLADTGRVLRSLPEALPVDVTFLTPWWVSVSRAG
ncbi:FecR domain-containing protein [Alloalcanivorax marinus]|uniref:FecR domain-containing protein n=1 Tax=Alloalcanivorax marinus TaxID=1177169 RepID=UPI0019349823|nr:FecR domain-containing protein [Alloalcanivorax marinus]